MRSFKGLFFLSILSLIWSCTKGFTEEEAPEVYVPLTITACVDTSSLTKTYMQDTGTKGIVKWSPSDYDKLVLYGKTIKLSAGIRSSSIEISQQDSTFAKFTFSIPTSEIRDICQSPSYIFYGDQTITISASSGAPVSIVLDACQQYSSSNCFAECTNASIGYIPSNSFTFNEVDTLKSLEGKSVALTMHNLFGILKVNVKLGDFQNATSADKMVSSIRITDKANNYLAGSFSINLEYVRNQEGNKYIDIIPSLQHVNGSGGDSYTIQVDAPDGVDCTNSTPFYFLIPPKKGDVSNPLFSTSGFDIAVYTKGGLYGGKTIKATGSIDRSYITTLPLQPFTPIPVPTKLERTANCYIVPADGKIHSIPAEYKGNGYQGNSVDIAAKANGNQIHNGSSAKILWQTRLGGDDLTGTEIISNPVYFNDSDKGQHYISFNTSNLTGSALVAVLDSQNNILWSWHIWVMTADEISTVGNGILLAKYESTTPDTYLMDRNLGAMCTYEGPTSFGLEYQFGRKDPFMGSWKGTNPTSGDYFAFYHTYPDTAISVTNSQITRAQSIKSPTLRAVSNNIWISDSEKNSVTWFVQKQTDNVISKTLHDPCPVGWRVFSKTDVDRVHHRSDSLLYFSGTMYQSSGTNPCYYFSCDNIAQSGLVYFPLAGYSMGNDGLNSVGSGAYLWTSNQFGNGAEAYAVRIIMKENKSDYEGCIYTPDIGATLPVRCVKFNEPDLPNSTAQTPKTMRSNTDSPFEVEFVTAQ